MFLFPFLYLCLRLEMNFKRLAANQWINRIFLIIIIAFSGIVMFMISQLDSIVHGQLYGYGLQFSADWANPYWNYTKIMYAGLAVTMAVSAVILLLGFIPKTKLAETIIKHEQPHPKIQPTPQIQMPAPVVTQPKQQPPPSAPQPQPQTVQPEPLIQTQPKPQPATVAIQEQPKTGKTPKENTKASNNCPNCKKSFTQPLVMLDFEGGKSKLVNVCPYCNQVLGDAEVKTE
jgi:outer membrane biosynthesis protein TonB